MITNTFTKSNLISLLLELSGTQPRLRVLFNDKWSNRGGALHVFDPVDCYSKVTAITGSSIFLSSDERTYLRIADLATTGSYVTGSVS